MSRITEEEARKLYEDHKEVKERVDRDDYSKNETHMAISNLLKIGDSYCRLLMLFDIIVDTDRVKTLCIEDDFRIKVVCDFYGIELSTSEKSILLDYLTKCKRERRAKIVLKKDITEIRDLFQSLKKPSVTKTQIDY